MPRRSPLIPMLLIGAIVCARGVYAASMARQPKMPTEQQFLQGQIHTLRPQRATKELPVSIEGRTLVHDARTDTHTISGAARVEQGPTTITADQIVLQQRYRGVATGHVHIIDPEVSHMPNEMNSPSMVDGFHLVVDVLKLNGIDTVYGVAGIRAPRAVTCKISIPRLRSATQRGARTTTIVAERRELRRTGNRLLLAGKISGTDVFRCLI